MLSEIALLVISLLYSPVTGDCSLNKIRPHITAIGRPASIKVQWHSVNSSGLVLYQVLYNKTSLVNHCVEPTTDALKIAKDCDQNSTREGVMYECDLTEEYKMLKMDIKEDSLCVVISIHSTSSNETCYSLFQEFNSYINEDQVRCPVPENFKVTSFEAGTLEVNWDFSPKFVSDSALSEMSSILHYEPVGQSNICTVKETKNLPRDFHRRNNSYPIQGLEPCCPYMVTICCVFSRSGYDKCHPGYISHPYYVTVAEQVPTGAPRVVMYHIQYTNLLIKWKISSNSLCMDKITAFEIQYWENQDKNCLTNNNGSTIKKYITSRSSDREANITGIMPTVAHCFRIRMCNNPGCSPWGKVRSVEEYPQKSAKRKAQSTGGLTKTTALVIAFGVLAFVLMVLFVIIMIMKIRNRQERPRRLQDEVPNLEPATDLLDSSQSTMEMELDDDYATVDF